jgi:transforming growth factor-beta-induced protein
MNRLLAAIYLVSVAEAAAEPKANIVKLAESVKDLSTLVAAVVAGDLADTLSSPGPFTVFAPTNEAFAALPAGTLTKLMKPENKKELVDILTYHVLPEEVLSKQLKPFQAVKTVEGNLLHVQEWAGKVHVGSSLESKDLKNVIKADNLASNGVVHIIDGVLIPPAATPKPNIVKLAESVNIVKLAESVKDLSTLVTAVVAADLAGTLSSPGPFTVFAPTNEAFAALPAGTLATLLKPANKAKLADILKYHVLPEEVLSTQLKPVQSVTTVEGQKLEVFREWGRVFLRESNHAHAKSVIKADNLASNGVVHIIDGVLLPPTPPPTPTPKPNIVKLAESVKDLSTLVAAVVAGDLADTLSSPGPFTVFAPTNEAFAALPAGTLTKLMKPENKKELVDILTYHVLPEEVLSKQLKPFQAVKTVEGKLLHVQALGGKVHVGSSLESKDLKNVIKADNVASNGVVHIIDGVLLPPTANTVMV